MWNFASTLKFFSHVLSIGLGVQALIDHADKRRWIHSPVLDSCMLKGPLVKFELQSHLLIPLTVVLCCEIFNHYLKKKYADIYKHYQKKKNCKEYIIFVALVQEYDSVSTTVLDNTVLWSHDRGISLSSVEAFYIFKPLLWKR